MKYVRMMIIGIFFGLAASYGVLTMIAVFNKEIVFSGPDMLEEFLIAIVLGAVIGLGSIIFQLERLTFLVQLIIHFIYVTLCVLIAGQIGGWYDLKSPFTIGSMLLIEVFIYAGVWLILSLMTQRDVDAINQKIKKNREDK